MNECMTQEDAMNMSDEQAVQILKPLRDMMIDQNGCPISDAVFALDKAIVALSKKMPTVEPLTDKEQRIFLAAMAREESICEEVDRNYVREPYEDSLVRTCKDIRRKVKGALWT